MKFDYACLLIFIMLVRWKEPDDYQQMVVANRGNAIALYANL
jgi:hypothetical protein